MEEEKRFDAEVYYTGGSVAWMILAHGFRGSAKTWKKQIDFFSKYYKLLVLEMHKRKDNEDLHLDKVCKFINNTLNGSVEILIYILHCIFICIIL